MCGSTNLLAQNTGDLKREILEEVLEEKKKGITIPSGERDNTEVGIGAESFIHCSKFDEDLMGISYMGSLGNWKLSLSTDNGDTWLDANLQTAELIDEMYPETQVIGGGDPVFVFDNEGNIHLTYIYLHVPADADLFDQNSWLFELFYAYSTDMGETWTSGESLAVGTFDMNDLAFVDRTWMDTDSDGNIYCGGTLFGSSDETGEAGTVVFKIDSGEFNFQTPAENAIPVDFDSQTQFTNVETDENGVVHVSGSLIEENQQTVVYTKSDSNGENYQDYTTLGNAIAFPTNTEVHSRENAAISLAVDGTNIYVAWTDFQGSNVLGYYVYSHDSGETFSEPISLGDLYFGDDYHIVMPSVAASEGNMVIAWHSVNKNDMSGEYIAAFSDDAGVSLSPSYYNISDDMTNYAAFGENAFFGDYNSTKMEGTIAHLTWTDSQEGFQPSVYYASIDFSTATAIAEIQPLSENFTLEPLYPNPITDEVTLNLYSSTDCETMIQVYSSDGKEMISQQFKAVAGSNTLTLKTSELSAGNYKLIISSDSGYVISKSLQKL